MPPLSIMLTTKVNRFLTVWAVLRTFRFKLLCDAPACHFTSALKAQQRNASRHRALLLLWPMVTASRLSTARKSRLSMPVCRIISLRSFLLHHRQRIIPPQFQQLQQKSQILLFPQRQKILTIYQLPTPSLILSMLHATALSFRSKKSMTVFFSEGYIGEGLAIEPVDGSFYAPFDCSVAMVFDTHHAIALHTANDTELILHVGLDTVKLNGQDLEVFVQEGQEIQKGDLILRADLEGIQSAGCRTVTPVIITGAGGAESVELLKQDRFTSETLFLKSIINVHPDRKFYLSTLTEKRSCNAAPFFV